MLSKGISDEAYQIEQNNKNCRSLRPLFDIARNVMKRDLATSHGPLRLACRATTAGNTIHRRRQVAAYLQKRLPLKHHYAREAETLTARSANVQFKEFTEA